MDTTTHGHGDDIAGFGQCLVRIAISGTKGFMDDVIEWPLASGSPSVGQVAAMAAEAVGASDAAETRLRESIYRQCHDMCMEGYLAVAGGIGGGGAGKGDTVDESERLLSGKYTASPDAGQAITLSLSARGPHQTSANAMAVRLGGHIAGQAIGAYQRATREIQGRRYGASFVPPAAPRYEDGYKACNSCLAKVPAGAGTCQACGSATVAADPHRSRFAGRPGQEQKLQAVMRSTLLSPDAIEATQTKATTVASIASAASGVDRGSLPVLDPAPAVQALLSTAGPSAEAVALSGGRTAVLTRRAMRYLGIPSSLPPTGPSDEGGDERDGGNNDNVVVDDDDDEEMAGAEQGASAGVEQGASARGSSGVEQRRHRLEGRWAASLASKAEQERLLAAMERKCLARGHQLHSLLEAADAAAKAEEQQAANGGEAAKGSCGVFPAQPPPELKAGEGWAISSAWLAALGGFA